MFLLAALDFFLRLSVVTLCCLVVQTFQVCLGILGSDTLRYYVLGGVFFFFFKLKTAYEMPISDWSSDVCSSDLCEPEKCARPKIKIAKSGLGEDRLAKSLLVPAIDNALTRQAVERFAHGRWTCREPLRKVERVEARAGRIGPAHNPRLQFKIDPFHRRARVHAARSSPPSR